MGININEKDILKLFSLIVLEDCTVYINNSLNLAQKYAQIWRREQFSESVALGKL